MAGAVRRWCAGWAAGMAARPVRSGPFPPRRGRWGRPLPDLPPRDPPYLCPRGWASCRRCGRRGVSVSRASGTGRAGAQRRSCRPRYPSARGDGDGHVSARGTGAVHPRGGVPPPAGAPGVRPECFTRRRARPRRVSSRPDHQRGWGGAAVPARKTGSRPRPRSRPGDHRTDRGGGARRAAGASPRGYWRSRRRAPPSSPAPRPPAGRRRGPDLAGGVVHAAAPPEGGSPCTEPAAASAPTGGAARRWRRPARPGRRGARVVHQPGSRGGPAHSPGRARSRARPGPARPRRPGRGCRAAIGRPRTPPPGPGRIGSGPDPARRGGAGPAGTGQPPSSGRNAGAAPGGGRPARRRIRPWCGRPIPGRPGRARRRSPGRAWEGAPPPRGWAGDAGETNMKRNVSAHPRGRTTARAAGGQGRASPTPAGGPGLAGSRPF